MTLAEKKSQLLATLTAIRDGQERFAWVVAQGRRHPVLEPALKTAANKVEGCLANLWLTAAQRDGRMFFQCDSDSAVVKGVAALLCDFYSGHPAAEILAVEPSFLREAGITQHLTANRRNALARVWEKISAAARAELPSPGSLHESGSGTGILPVQGSEPRHLEVLEKINVPLDRRDACPTPDLPVRLYDAHNHLQDDRFGGQQAALLAACRAAGLARMVVNGAGESDWPDVQRLARAFPEVLPSFGCHPWYLHERTPDWLDVLKTFLDDTPGSAIGEIGLDRWKPGLAYDDQEEVFTAQITLAAGRNLPVSIHCLQAWGRMHDLLRAGPRPARGFLLHSYGGPAEMIAPLAELGAYFSFPGYYAHARKARQRETFKLVTADRLLIETNAPDQSLPDERNTHPLADSATGKPINHPANLRAVYQCAAELRGEPVDVLAARVEENFQRLFGAR